MFNKTLTSFQYFSQCFKKIRNSRIEIQCPQQRTLNTIVFKVKKEKITKFYIYLTDHEDYRYNREWRGCGAICCNGYCSERTQYAAQTWREERGRPLTRRERRERGRRWATSGGRGGRRGRVFF